MKISTKGRYGMRAALELSLRYGSGPVMVREISDSQEISERYLEQLLIPLKLVGLVRVSRGAHGGFTLARPPSEIRLIEIVQTMEGSNAPVECVDNAQICSRGDTCITRDVWTEIKQATDRILEATTLQDLIQRQKQPVSK